MLARACSGAALLALLALPVSFAFAQADRHYDYASFVATYSVRKDTTVDVAEALTYRFTGTYHNGSRSIAKKGSDAITDIRVYDTDLDHPLRLTGEADGTDSASWGTYSVTSTGDAENVAWHYALTDTQHTWIVTYRLHGALAFYQDHDELYWNLFTGLSAPVEKAEAFVVLPGEVSTPLWSGYVNGNHGMVLDRPDARTFHFLALNFAAQEPVTIAAGWQKGLVDQRAYWRDWFISQWPYVVSGILLLVTALFCGLWWFFTERYKQGTGIIVAQYEPPRGLPPLEMELIVKERISSKSWAATVVDLAVRGYVRIEEQPQKYKGLLQVLGVLPIVVIGALILLILGLGFGNSGVAITVPIFLFLAFDFAAFAIIVRTTFKASLIARDYVVRNLQKDEGLKPYEQGFMDQLFHGGTEFSTRELKKSTSRQRVMYAGMKALEKSVLEETDTDTGAYARTLAHERFGKGIFAVAIFALMVVFFILPGSLTAGAGYAALLASCVLCVTLIVYFVRFEARLSPEGQLLKEQCLGFKLYLHTAERYRLQNLTPEAFEKYLPYAIIFGVEKSWAHAFESFDLAPPNWYVGAYAASGSSGPVSFSPSSFASSFSASFASSFASSGASGASGGGGGAGGGGGGGGGGAS
ncbi:MAG: hypothetical protein JWO84_221 [Parcubacteria group bacterium]|nr:hypothetical protein [Parcubacteria group bacterium]